MSNVVPVMDAIDESGGEWTDDAPMTRRCVYVQDRDSQRWSAEPVAVGESASSRTDV